ncbi:MAG: hypothetical protein AAF333_09610 [Planctomycetota bacterium]
MTDYNTTTTQPQPVSNGQGTKRRPVMTVDHFPLRAAVWDNITREGEVFYSVTFERAYKNKDGQWNSSQNFNRSDLLGLAKLADAVDTEIREMLDAERDARRVQEQAA